MKKFNLLLFTIFFLIANAFSQGLETFTGMPASNGSYLTRSWTGDNSVTWTCTDARTDQTITTRAIGVRNSTLTSGTISGGIGDINFNYKYIFTGSAASLTVKVNGTTVATIAVPSSQTTAINTGTIGVNVSANAIIEITQTVTGARVAIDDLAWTSYSSGTDVTPPTVAGLSPADNATNVSPNTALQITFSEPVIKGSGNILIKNSLDNTTVQTINVSSPNVTTSGSTAAITISALGYSAGYYVEIDAGAFTDAALNAFAGISGTSTWNFTTAAPPAAGVIGTEYSFANCPTTFTSEGWTQYSVTDPAHTWMCVSPGRTAAPDYGVQMNAFVASNNNPLNEDWLISPVFDLTGTNMPTLKFYSKGDFNGNSLQLKASNNYTPGTDPTTATWTDLNGNFPANVAGQGTWKLSDNIDLSAFNTANITVAWVYMNTTTTASSRWTIDDVTIYTQVVLPPCSEPAEQPTNLILSSTPNSVSGTYTTVATPTTIENYLIVRTPNTPLTALPVDGVTYTPGSIINGGNGIAITTSNDGTFVDNTVAPNTAYSYYIFSIEDVNCGGAPNYLQINPLTGNITTPPTPPCSTPAAAPTALSFTAANTTITGSFTPSATANTYLTIVSTSNTLSANPVDGTTYSSGQAFGGGTVVSFGSSSNFVATGLTPATTYYFFVFAANSQCTGQPFYNTMALNGSANTTNNANGIPAGYYNAAAGLNCQPLKTALKNIITNGANVLTYTPGIWNLYQYSDQHRNDANTADIIWDMYSDNPTGPEPYTYTYGINQCGTYSVEGQCYNREHSTPQSFFASASPMVTDAHHIFPTDGKVNGVRSNFPYGEVSAASTTSLNGSKLGTGTNFGYSGTVFEPIDAYKGDFARACLYMATRYEDEIINTNWSANGTANALFLSSSDQSDAAIRRLNIYDTWQLQTLLKWHQQDPVSQKEIDRNNVIYSQAVNTGSATVAQNNRNPFVDHPEYVAMVYQCTGLLPVTLIDFSGKASGEATILSWQATLETNFKEYIVERAFDGIAFTGIGVVKGENLTNYHFTDASKRPVDVVYYRLKMVDIDGRTEYSKTIALRFGKTLHNVLIYPNPTSGDTKVVLNEPLKAATMISLVDITGRKLLNFSGAVGQSQISLSLQKLPAGKYILQIVNAQQSMTEQIMIVK